MSAFTCDECGQKEGHSTNCAIGQRNQCMDSLRLANRSIAELSDRVTKLEEVLHRIFRLCDLARGSEIDSVDDLVSIVSTPFVPDEDDE